MTDHLLNNVRDLLVGYAGDSSVNIDFSVHNVKDLAATEVVGHLDKGWSWNANGTIGTQWLTGTHDSGVSVTLFLAEVPKPPDAASRAQRVLAAANLTGGA